MSAPAASASAATRSGDSGVPSSRSSRPKARAASPTCAATSRAAVRALSSKLPAIRSSSRLPCTSLADDDGHDERALRPQPFGQPGQRLGRLVEPDLARGQLVERQASALELDRERRRGAGDRAHDQVAPRSASTIRARTTSAPGQARRGTRRRARSTSPSRPPRAAARPASASASSAPGSSPARSLRSGCTAIPPLAQSMPSRSRPL